MTSRVAAVMLMLLCALSAAAQYKVKCTVNDQEGQGEPFATVKIVLASDTTKIIAMNVTELDGTFEQALVDGSYILSVTAVGKVEQARSFSVSAITPVADLGIIILPTAENVLQAVTVTSQKVLVKNEIDRLSYDVQSDGDSKTKTVMDMLRKVPLVSVDGQDNIRVKGGTSFKIYKNGHPDAMLSANPKEVLKAIPASMIKKIEVITEPGAKYDAEGVGAILNIVTLEASMVKGVTGSVGAMLDNYGDYNLNGFLTGQYGKFITSVHYGMFHANRHRQHSFSDSEHNYITSGNSLISNQESRGTGNVHFGNIEASYEPDTLNLFTLNFGGHYGGFGLDGLTRTRMLNGAGYLIYGYNSNFKMPDYGFFSFNGRFDYQHKTHRKDETLTLSYLLSTTRNTQESFNSYSDMVNFAPGYDAMNRNNRENFVEHTLQFDWARPFAVHNKIETGVKYIHRSNRSRTWQDFLADNARIETMSTFNRLNHVTQVAAAYLSYTYSYDKWTARAGLRYEFSRLSASFPLGDQADYHTNLSDWVPSASVNYQFDWANSLKFAFATRIARPGISFLNPAVNETAETRSYGDPHLSSARNYSLSLTYMHIGPKFTFNITPSYDFSNNSITGVQFIGTDGKEVSTYRNTLSERSFGLNGFFQWQIHAKTSLMFNGSVTYSRLKSRDLNLKNSGWGEFIYAHLTQQLPWKLRLTVGGGYFGGGAEGLYSKSDGMCFYNLGLQRSFLKDDRLTVSINAQNPFNGKYSSYTNRTVYGDYTGFDRSRWVNRSFSINISYRFGSLNAQVKKTATTIDNNDVVGGSDTSGGQSQGQGQQQGGMK